MSRPDSHSPVSFSLRWVIASENMSSCDSDWLNRSRRNVNRLCCSAGGTPAPAPRSQVM
jgi:hypothetical protein